MQSSPLDNPDVKGTIQKTLMTSLLFEGFWERWIAHGIEKKAVTKFRHQLKSVEHWIGILKKQAEHAEKQAQSFLEQSLPIEAEYSYRVAGLYYNLIQWLFPKTGDEKRRWFTSCKDLFKQADALSKDKIIDVVVQVDGKDCIGRIRVPESPKGCVVVINPIDSSKEELFTYEMHFSKLGFVTVSFDGPGQGETYVFNKYKATPQRWNLFVNEVIDFAAARYPELKIYLFGTSSGAAWAIQGSCHPKVTKVVSVSPACKSKVKIPDYFMERMSYILDENSKTILPELEDFERCNPILLFHGKKDVMVKNEDICQLYNKLPRGKSLIVYENEGHCCNFKLNEVREISTQWFLGDNV